MVSACFMLTGGYAAFAAIMIARVVAGRPSVSAMMRASDLVPLAGVSALAYGCLRISRLLDRRRKEGIIEAGVFLLAPLAGYITGSPPGAMTLATSALGVILLAGVWRHLR